MNTDPHPLTGDAHGPPSAVSGVSRAEVMRALLWLGLVLSTVGNLVSSLGGAPLPVHLALGAVICYCLVALVTQRLRSRV